MDDRSRILVATDLSASSEAALARARDHALATKSFLVVCHVVPDAIRNNPLFPQRNETDLLGATNILKQAGDLVDEQLTRLSISPDQAKVVIESGSPEEEIVRIAEEEKAALVVVGAKARSGIERLVGHVAERVVRYAHAPVLVARAAPRSGRILVATDFSESSRPAHAAGAQLVAALGVEATLLHVLEMPPVVAPGALSALGNPWIPPPATALTALRELGLGTLRGLVEEHRFAHADQVEGDPAETIAAYAETISAEMIIVGSRGRTRLRRLVLGSVAEATVRRSTCSVLVARD